MALPDSVSVGLVIIALVAIVVLYDLWRIWPSHSEMPNLGRPDNGGFAWASGAEHELTRDVPGPITISSMMV